MAQTAVAPVDESASPSATSRRRFRWLYVVLGVLLLAAGTYTFAWYRAYRLSMRFMENAAESFEAGNYLNALTGFNEFDEAANRYVYRGGYGQVALIWADPYAWPRPAALTAARARTDEIIQQRLTVDDAEAYIEENAGQGSPYLGRIYLRTGELYEEAGDTDDAADVYEEVADLFPNDAALNEQANAHLKRLEAKK